MKKQTKRLGSTAKKPKLASKLAAKTPSKTPSAAGMMPGVNGGSLRVGNPGNSGGGRPPSEFKVWCAELLDDPNKRKQVEEILDDKDHPAFATVWKAICERVHGKPTEKVSGDHTVSVVVRHE